MVNWLVLAFMFVRIREDIQAIQSRDPAARSALDIWLSYPGFHAIRLHRIAMGGLPGRGQVLAAEITREVDHQRFIPQN